MRHHGDGCSKSISLFVMIASLYLSSINVLRPFIYRDYYLSDAFSQVFVIPPSRSMSRVRRRGSSSCDALWKARGSPNNSRLALARVTAV